MDDLIKIKKTLPEYAEEVVSAVLQSVPFTGGLAKYLDSYFPTQQKRLITAFIQSLHEQGTAIQSINCDLERLRSLVLQTLNGSLLTSSEMKRMAFRALLLNYAYGKTADQHVLDACLQILAVLSELDIRIVQIGSTVNCEGKDSFGWNDGPFVNEQLRETPASVIWISYNRLRDFGMFAPKWLSTGPKGLGTPMWAIELSDFGHDFLGWINR